ncbi:MAG TPA: Sec-independent protein translocase subunit TatA [Kineosporiaceae bacterium]|nr:Sec-independent protein translocase subunit TatA [Kineosporiaceae bacterium]
MRALEPWHFIVLAAVVVVLFGGKRLPDAARGLGRSMRIFKSEIKQLNDETPTATPSAPQPLEGRVVDGEAGRSATPTEQRRDA